MTQDPIAELLATIAIGVALAQERARVAAVIETLELQAYRLRKRRRR
jgi:hypothetical protein